MIRKESKYYDQMIIDAMPGTAKQIGQRVGLASSAMARRLTALRQSGRIHIAHWKARDLGHGRPSAFWAVGPEPEKAQPIEIKRVKITPVRVVVPPRRDPLVAAFFGEAHDAVCADS